MPPHPSNHRRLPARPKAVVIALLLAAMLPAPAALAEQPAANTRRSYAIGPGTLEDVLTRFAAVAGMPLSFDPALVANRNSPGITGNHSGEEGLRLLLQGSGLAVQPKGDGAYTLIKAPHTQQQPATSETTLAAVTVKADAERESAWGPVRGYVAKRSATATKTDTAIIETPQSVTVVTAEEIEIRKPKNLVETLGYAAGVTTNTASGDQTSEDLNLRGFNSGYSFFRDGTKYNGQVYDGQQELYGLERVELLRGASSVLYGANAPGGILNTISKRPNLEPLREINLEYGSFNRKQISGDFGGSLTEDGAWTWRITGLKREGDSFLDHVSNDRTYIAPALKWSPSVATSLTLLSEYQRDKAAYDGGLPFEGTILTNPNGKIPRNRFAGIPGHDGYNNKKWSMGYLFEHAFSEDLKLRNSLRYFKASRDFAYAGDGGTLDASDYRTLSDRYSSDRTERSEVAVADTALQYGWESAGISHTSLAGFDYTWQKFYSLRQNGRTVSPMDLYAPTYGTISGAPSFVQEFTDRTKQFGIYLQDQMKIANRWVLTLGARHDRASFKEAYVYGPPGDMTSAPTSEQDSATTGRAGLVYLAGNGLAPFISFSQSFEPQTGVDRDGNHFKPTRGEQWEVGIRYQPIGSNSLLSAAFYDLTRSNVTVTDPIDQNYSIQKGKVRSRGIELEAKTSVTRNTNLIAAYAYTDARTIDSSPTTPEEKGQRTVGIPLHQFSIWGDHNLGSIGLGGVTVGGGVRHVGSSRSSAEIINHVSPSYTVFDAMIRYVTGPWKLALNITNLTDKSYVTCPYSSCRYGEPRNIIGTLSYRW